MFEGEYLNGVKRFWKRKEYDEVGNIIFEGGYLNGIKNGGNNFSCHKKFKIDITNLIFVC